MNQELITLIPTLSYIKNKGDINESTRIEEDLKLRGHYVRQFIFKYADLFNVDISGFKFNKYFSREIPFLPSFLRKKKYQLTLGDLEKAIKYGKLNETTIKEIAATNNSAPPRKKLIFGSSAGYKPEEILVFVLVGIAITVLLGWVTLLWA